MNLPLCSLVCLIEEHKRHLFEFSALSLAVFIPSPIEWHTQEHPCLELKICLKFCPVSLILSMVSLSFRGIDLWPIFTASTLKQEMLYSTKNRSILKNKEFKGYS